MAAVTPTSLWAQTEPTPAPAMAELRGVTPGGQPVVLETLRGRVVMVFFWSTECAVCRNKMPELRANAAGWHGQDFTLLGVNMDSQEAEFLRYERVVTPLLPPDQRFLSVWAGNDAYRDNLGPIDHLPTSVLVDKDGRPVERYSGRIPPQAWNRIADLL